MLLRSFPLSLFPDNYFSSHETGAGGSVTFRTPLPYASPQLTRFVIDERLYIASNNSRVWVVVTKVTETDEYMEYEADVMSGNVGTFVPRTTVISYGLPNEGYILHKTTDVGQPYVDVSRHTGSPWKDEDITNILRFGYLGGLPLAEQDTPWLSHYLRSAPEEPPNEYGLALGPDYVDGAWQVFSTLRQHGSGQGHTWETNSIEVGGVDPNAVGTQLAWWIGSKTTPVFWFTANGIGGTSLLDDGVPPSDLAMLLGTNTPRNSNSWTSAQGHVAQISGAYRLDQGPFSGTQCLVVLPAGINLIENPVFEHNVVDYWTGSTGLPTKSSTMPRWGSECCRIVQSAANGASLYKITAIATPSQGDYITLSAFFRTPYQEMLGKNIAVVLSEVGGTSNWASLRMPVTNSWQRVCLTHEVSQAGLTGIDIYIVGYGDVDDAFFIDGINLTATDHPLPHIDGDLDGCTWSGTPHNSASFTDEATIVDLDDDVDVINYQPELSIGMWVRAPYDSDRGLSDIILMDATSATAGMDQFKIYFDSSWMVYCQGGERLFAIVEIEDELHFSNGDQVFVVLTLNFESGAMEFYVNGASWGSFSGSVQEFAFAKWRLGGDCSDTGQSGLGIGEVTVYHRILSATEVAELYRRNQPTGGGTTAVQGSETSVRGLTSAEIGTTYGGRGACGHIFSPGANYNTVIGHGAMYCNETGDGNCVYGYQAGYGATGKSYSEGVLIGYQAGYSLKNIKGCTFVGYRAGYGFDSDSAGSNSWNTFIGWEAAYTHGGYSNTVIGAGAGHVLASMSSENVIVGAGTASEATTLTTSTIVGCGAGDRLTGEYDCTFIGYGAGGYAGALHGLAVENTYIGSYAGNYNEGYENTCVGRDSGQGNFDSDYNYCTILGAYAGWKLETAHSNVLIGHDAAFSLSTGDGKNVIIGASACGTLYAAHTYAENVVVGWEAGYSMAVATENVLIGYQAGYSLTDDRHVFIGYQAGYGYSSAYWGNICIGYQAGYAHGGSHAILIGYQAGLALTATATENVVIGEWAAEGATEIECCVLIGGYAGASLSSEYGCTFVGYAAGSKVGYGGGGTALYNTYIGDSAGQGAGAYNVCVGSRAGEGVISTSTYSQSVIIGHEAGQALTTGSNNVLAGYQAGMVLSTGHSNVFLGYQAGNQATTAYEAVLIGYKAGFTLDSTGGNVCIGNLAGYNVGINDDCVYIGEHAGRNIDDGSANTAVGTSALEGADTSLVSGVANTTAIGYFTLSNIKTGYRNDAHGHCSQFSNEDGYDNVAVGYYSLYYNATGNKNVAVGANAGKGVSGQSHDENVLIGCQAGYGITTGDGNVFTGFQAGYGILDGYLNVAVGSGAGLELTAGAMNTFLGAGAGKDCKTGDENTFVGYGAGQTGSATDQSGDRNVAIGAYSASDFTTAAYNVLLGWGAGDTLSTHTNNVFVGHNVGHLAATSGSVLIGYEAGESCTTDNRLYIHNSSSTTPLIYGEFDNAILKIYGTLIVNEGGLAGYDVRFESDNNDKMFWLDASGDLIQLGDPTGGNYSQFDCDGLLTMTGIARVTVDRYIDAAGLKAPGAKPATYIQHGLAGAWQFADEAVAGNQQSISGKLPLPSQMDRTVVPVVKAGWSANGVSPGNCEWQLEYRYMSPNDDTTATAQETLTVIGTASSTTDGLTITAFSGIDLPSSTDAAMFFKLTRLSAGTNDTIVDTTELHGMIFTHTIDKLGTAT